MPEEYEEDYDSISIRESDSFTKRDIDLETANIVGPCYKTSKIDNILDEIDADGDHISYDDGTGFSINRTSGEKTLDPPRMQAPEEVDDLLDLEAIVYSQANEEDPVSEDNDLDAVYMNLDIPDAPKEDMGELF